MKRQNKRPRKESPKESGKLRLAGMLEMPATSLSGMASLQLSGNREAVVEGCQGILEYGEDTVDHLQHPLHLAAEIGVSGGVHNIDLNAVPNSGSVFGQDGDAPFPLQVAAVHDAVGYRLIFPECAALFEHLVDQSGFAVVNVGDDSYVA